MVWKGAEEGQWIYQTKDGKNGAPKEEEKRKVTQKVLGCSEHMKEQGHVFLFCFLSSVVTFYIAQFEEQVLTEIDINYMLNGCFMHAAVKQE